MDPGWGYAPDVESPAIAVWQRATILMVIMQAALLQLFIYDDTVLAAPEAAQIGAAEIAVRLGMSFILWRPMPVFVRDRPMAEKYSRAQELLYAYGIALICYLQGAHMR